MEGRGVQRAITTGSCSGSGSNLKRCKKGKKQQKGKKNWVQKGIDSQFSKLDILDDEKVQRGTTAGECLKQRKKQWKRNWRHVSGVQSGITIDEKEKQPICESSELEDVLTEVQSGITIGEKEKQPICESSELEKVLAEIKSWAEREDRTCFYPWMELSAYCPAFHPNPVISSSSDIYAGLALKFYKAQKKDAEYEIERVLFALRTSLIVPGYEGLREWCHVSFVAKCKNQPREHFFGEMWLEPLSRKREVIHCSTFIPSGAGLTYGCGFCDEAPTCLHPAYDYVAGLPSSTRPTRLSKDYVDALESCSF